MDEAIRATQAYLKAIDCLPEDYDYREQFNTYFAEERLHAEAAEKRRHEAEEKRLERAHELAMAQLSHCLRCACQSALQQIESQIQTAPVRPTVAPRSNPPEVYKPCTSSQTYPVAAMPPPVPTPAPRTFPSPGTPAGSKGRTDTTTPLHGCDQDAVNEDTIPRDGPVHALTALTPTGGPHVKGEVKTCRGTLNATPIEVLLDTGCDTIFVARRLVDPTEYTGKMKPVRTAMGLHPGCPVAKVTFDCPYFPGGPTLVVVLDDPPYDVLLGQVPGTLKFNEDPSPTPAPDEENSPVGPRDPPTDGSTTSSSWFQLPLPQVESANYLPSTHGGATKLSPPSRVAQVVQQRHTLPPRGCSLHGARAAHTSEDCWDLHPVRRPTIWRDPDNWRGPTTAPSLPLNLHPVRCCCRRQHHKWQSTKQHWWHCYHKGPDLVSHTNK